MVRTERDGSLLEAPYPTTMTNTSDSTGPHHERPAFDSQTLGRKVNELVLLALLGSEPMHGYQVAAEAERRSGGYFTFSHGTLYPHLHRLEKEGLIAGAWSEAGGGRPRKEYALTPSGRRYLEAALDEWRILDRHLARIAAPSTGREASSGESDGAVRGGAA